MVILVLRTDNPTAEIGLYNKEGQLAYEKWQAHRQLAETIHTKIAKLLKTHQYELHDLTGIVVYQGPGSFTGLRIGMSVANALAYGLDIPISGQTGEGWQTKGLKILAQNKGKTQVLPKYGAPVHITKPKR